MNYYDDEGYYFIRDIAENHAWPLGMLRYGDQLPAIAYALGWCDFDALRRACGFKDEGLEPYPKRTLAGQLALIEPHRTRPIFSALVIGDGRGEFSNALACVAHQVTAIEPSAAAPSMIAKTVDRYTLPNGRVRLLNCTLAEAPINPNDYDTIFLVESIEHIAEEEWWTFFSRLRPGQRLIITNWMFAHPLLPVPATLHEHIFPITDEVYERIGRDHNVVFQQGSHLVVDTK